MILILKLNRLRYRLLFTLASGPFCVRTDKKSRAHLLPCFRFHRIYTLNSKTLATLWLWYNPFWLVWVEIECTMHAALPRRPINQFKPVKQSRQQVLRFYCPNIFVAVFSSLPQFILQLFSAVRTIRCRAGRTRGMGGTCPFAPSPSNQC